VRQKYKQRGGKWDPKANTYSPTQTAAADLEPIPDLKQAAQATQKILTTVQVWIYGFQG